MGTSTSSDNQKSKQKLNNVQTQVIEQNYANNIMMVALSTLESICRKLLGRDNRSASKKYGQQDKVDFSSKTLTQLISQLKTHLFLFKTSKKLMDEEYKDKQGFVFPKNFTKEKVLQQLANFKEICYSANDPVLLRFCDDFANIVNGKYQSLSFQKVNVKVQYTKEEKQEMRKRLLKDGIDATNMMDQLKNKVQKQGISNQSDLEVAINKTDVEYERQGKKIIQKCKI